MPRKRASKRRRPRLEVWKFGGASLADAAAVRHAVSLIKAHRGPLVVVVSALAGVTDLLLDGARRSVAGDPEAASAAAATFLRRHRDLAHALVPAGAGATAPARLLRRAGPRVPRDRARDGRPRRPLPPGERHPRGPRGARRERGRGGGPARRGPPRRARGRGGDRRDRRPPRRRRPRPRRHAPERATAPRAAPEARRHAGRARVPRLGPRRHGHDPRPRRLRPHRDAPRPVARRVARRALEGRGRHPHRRPARGARRPAPPADAPPRGRGGRLLRRQGPAPARPHPPRRERASPSTCARSCTPSGPAPRSRRGGRSPPTR